MDYGLNQSFLYKTTAFSADILIPLIMAELKPLCSISLRPAMVQPLGDVTLSISCSGCDDSCNSKSAAPLAVCAAILSASCAWKPISVPPCEAARIERRKNAMPHAQSAVAEVIS